MLKNKAIVNLLLIFVITLSMCSIILFLSKNDKGKLYLNKTYYNFLIKK